MSGLAGDPGPLPRPLLWIGTPVVGLLLVVFFVYMGFPYDRLRDQLAVQVGNATGARVEIGALEPAPSLLGPGLRARTVVAHLRDGGALRLDRARLRPAWSLGWLTGDPAVALDVSGDELGRVKGTATLGDAPGFDGDVADLALAQLPLRDLLGQLQLDGVVTGDVDIEFGDAGPEGRLDLFAVDGSLGLPGMPLALPFAELQADVELGTDPRVRIERFSLEGPMLSVSGEGTVGASPIFDRAPLDLALRIEVREPSFRPMIQGLGVRLDRNGATQARVGGTVGRPQVR